MPKQNFKSHAKRKRELAKLDKRTAKDQKRADKRGDSSDPGSVVTPVVTPAAPGARPAVAVAPKLTLAEIVERWKTTKVVKTKPRF
jgi:hypothetical protein